MCHSSNTVCRLWPDVLWEQTLQSFFCPIKITCSFPFSLITSEVLCEEEAELVPPRRVLLTRVVTALFQVVKAVKVACVRNINSFAVQLSSPMTRESPEIRHLDTSQYDLQKAK
ncbi:hypothetical protein M0804_004318 [Polistes exclamans]|nr:hypothetical protein M0804_004318 [Polistes exclamans]